MPLIGEIDSSTGRQRGYIAMQKNTYTFICHGCQQTLTSHAYNAKYCKKAACQAVKDAEDSRRHLKRRALKCR